MKRRIIPNHKLSKYLDDLEDESDEPSDFAASDDSDWSPSQEFPQKRNKHGEDFWKTLQSPEPSNSLAADVGMNEDVPSERPVPAADLRAKDVSPERPADVGVGAALHIADEESSGEDDCLAFDSFIWNDLDREDYLPKKKIPVYSEPIVMCDVNRASTELEVFQKLFPKSLVHWIVDCTNRRIAIAVNNSSKPMAETDYGEMLIVLGCMLVFSYNKVPDIADYWSENPSLGNKMIQEVISRSRFQAIHSKMYFNVPEKPTDCSKTYYIDDLAECLKKSFQRCRTDSTYQSIDESMVKFKGRSSLKQYLPLKPIKRGVKIWERCDSKSGYVYDFNIYAGKETESVNGTLGERVVNRLLATLGKKDVIVAMDRFFTSVRLLCEAEVAMVATAMKNRKFMPSFTGKLKRSEAEFQVSSRGIVACRWMDSKDVLVLSNCHGTEQGEVLRKQKTGEKLAVNCPEAIITYNQIMGGVDISDQNVSCYDIDRKSNKWWKKVFYKLLMTAAVNSWVIFKDVKNKNALPLKTFLVNLSEVIITKGLEETKKRRKLAGRKTKLIMRNIGSHLPVEGPTRRRCKGCTASKKEFRTKTICSACNIPLCKHCFASYHK